MVPLTYTKTGPRGLAALLLPVNAADAVPEGSLGDRARSATTNASCAAGRGDALPEQG